MKILGQQKLMQEYEIFLNRPVKMAILPYMPSFTRNPSKFELHINMSRANHIVYKWQTLIVFYNVLLYNRKYVILRVVFSETN